MSDLDLDSLFDEILPDESPSDAPRDDGALYRAQMLRARRVRLPLERRRRKRPRDEDDDESPDPDDPHIKRPRAAVGDESGSEVEPVAPPPLMALQGVGGPPEEEETSSLIPIVQYIPLHVAQRRLQLRNAGNSDGDSSDEDDSDDEPGLTEVEKRYCVLCHFKPQRQDEGVRHKFEELLGIMIMRYAEMERTALARLAQEFYNKWIRHSISNEPYWSIKAILEHIEHHEVMPVVQRVRTIRALLTILEVIQDNQLISVSESGKFTVSTHGTALFLKLSKEVHSLLRRLESDNQATKG